MRESSSSGTSSPQESISPLDTKRQISYYDTLEISPESTRIQIREAYIRLKNTYSKSNQALYSLFTPEETQLSLDTLEEAYKVLYDEQLRRDYDEGLSGGAPRQKVQYQDPFLRTFRTEGNLPSKTERGSLDSDIWGEQELIPVKGETAKKMRFSGAALCEGTQESISKIVSETETFDGAFLKKLRESQDVSLHELQERTKVSLQYIIAMENNDFQTLPSVVYVKGFLKILLQYMGVKKEVSQIVNKYLECIQHWRIKNGKELY